MVYWNILRSREEYESRKLAFEQASDFIKQNKREFELGNRTYTDVVQAEASAAFREEDMLVAESAIQNQEDELKRLFNDTNPSFWQREILIADRIDPNLIPIEVKQDEYIQIAFNRRPDYLKAKETLKNAELSLAVAKNGLLPNLSLDYSSDVNAADDSSRSFFNMVRKDKNFPDWSAGLTVTIPWGLQSEMADYHEKANSLRRQQLTVDDLASQIIKEVRASVREVKTNTRRVRIAQTAFDLSLKKLEAEQKKYAVGISTSFEVLTYQQDLATASVRRIGAIVDYHQSIIRLWNVLGITLEQNGVVFEGV